MLRPIFATLPLAAILLACGGDSLDGGSNTTNELFVRQALAPNATAGADACNYKPESTWPSLAEGVIDVSVRDRYDATLLLQAAQTNAGFRLESAHVRVLEGVNGPVIGEKDSVVSGFVDPGALGVAQVQAFDAVTVEKILDLLKTDDSRLSMTLEISVKAAGASSGAPSTTPVFRFPITACKGCLVSYESGRDPAVPHPNCSLPLGKDDRVPCFVGQDELVPCQACLDKPICQNPFNK